MKTTLKRKIAFSLIFSIAILILFSVYSYNINSSLTASATNRSKSYQNLIHIERLMEFLTDAETGERGFVITGNEEYLQPFHIALDKINTERKFLAKLTETGDITDSQRYLLDSLIELRVAEMNKTISARRNAGSENMLSGAVYDGMGKTLMDEIRSKIKDIKELENGLINKYVTEVDIHQTEAGIIIPAATIFSALVIILGSFVINKEINERYKTEKELLQSEEKLKSEYVLSLDLYNNAPCGYHLLDKNGLIVEINTTELDWLGYKRDDVVNKMKLTDFLASEEMKLKFQENFKKIIETSKASDLEFVIKRKDGSTFPISLSATSIYDSAGIFLQSRTTMFDITERKKSEDNIRRVNAELEQQVIERTEQLEKAILKAKINGKQLEAVFHAMNDGVVVYDMMGDALIVNESEARINGFASAEEMKRNLKYFAELYEISDFDENLVPIKDWPVSRIMRGEELKELQLRSMRKDTEEEKYFSFSGAPVFDENEIQIMAVTVTQDITERMKIESGLRDAKDRYQRVVDNIKEALITDDSTGNVTFANDQFLNLFGLTKNELSTLKLEDYVAEPWRVLLRDRHERRMRGESITDQYEFQGIRKDGKLIWLDATVSSRKEDGKIIGSQSAIRDITERKLQDEKILNMNTELEQKVYDRTEQLSDSNRELESFSYSVSHDLRTPLRHIIGFGEKLQIIAADHINSEDQRLINKMKSSAEKMARLIDDLLNFSRVGRTELEKRRISLQSIVNEFIDEYKENEDNKNIEWILGVLPEVNADPIQLHIVISNLISNAVKYTRNKEKRIIEIGHKIDERENIFYVKDNGAGFNMKYSSKLFGVFQRLHSDYEYEGTGIGLATVRRIISRHGGRTWAEGETGIGAVIYFTLPNN